MHASMFHRSVLMACCLPLTAGTASACDGPREVREATVATIKAFIRSKQMTVLSFAGYSGAQYEDPEAMIGHASRILDAQDPVKTLINVGATEVGIGTVHELAKRRGFTTMGIVSTLARDERVPLSSCVDHVFYVKDNQWGGKIPGTDILSTTSVALVGSGTSFFAIGGGETTRSLSGSGLIYCGKALLARFPGPFRQIAMAILLKRSENLSQNGFPSLRSPKSDRLLGMRCSQHARPASRSPTFRPT